MMEFLLTIFGACLIGLGVGLMFYNKKSEAKKPWKPKKKGLFDSICDIRDISHSPSKRYRR